MLSSVCLCWHLCVCFSHCLSCSTCSSIASILASRAATLSLCLPLTAPSISPSRVFRSLFCLSSCSRPASAFWAKVLSPCTCTLMVSTWDESSSNNVWLRECVWMQKCVCVLCVQYYLLYLQIHLPLSLCQQFSVSLLLLQLLLQLIDPSL